MRIIRAIHPMAVSAMQDKLLPDPDYSVEKIAEGYKDLLINYPKETYLLQVWMPNESGNNILVAFLMAFSDPRTPWVSLLQAWADPSLAADEATKDVTYACYTRFQLWAESLGKTKIRAETMRVPEALLRRWGFEQLSVVLEAPVNPDILSLLEEAADGKIIKFGKQPASSDSRPRSDQLAHERALDEVSTSDGPEDISSDGVDLIGTAGQSTEPEDNKSDVRSVHSLPDDEDLRQGDSAEA